MACYDYLSDFIKPFKFGFMPCIVSRINYDTNQVENVTLTNPASYRLAPDCPSPIILEWLNTKGGYDVFVFTGKHTRGTGTSGGSIYENGEGEELYSSRGKTRKYIQVVSQYLSPEDKAILVDSLLPSPQVYWYESVGQYISWKQSKLNPPAQVRIAEGEYAKYKERSGELINLTFKMTVAKIFYTQTL